MVNYQIKTLKTNEVRKHGVDELWVSVLARAVEDALDGYDGCQRRITRTMVQIL